MSDPQNEHLRNVTLPFAQYKNRVTGRYLKGTINAIFMLQQSYISHHV